MGEISAWKSGDVSATQLKKVLSEHVEWLVVKRDLTLGEFLSSPAIQTLHRHLDVSDLDDHLLISHPDVKRRIINYFAEMVLTITPKPVSKYFDYYQNTFFAGLVRPSDPKKGGFLLPEGVHPLAMGMLLRNLGYLRWRDENYFENSFNVF